MGLVDGQDRVAPLPRNLGQPLLNATHADVDRRRRRFRSLVAPNSVATYASKSLAGICGNTRCTVGRNVSGSCSASNRISSDLPQPDGPISKAAPHRF